jgi:hypothetical protein
MNIPLLEAVRQSIVRFPGRFCAAQWAFARNATQVLRQGASPDGFCCCIAGHVLLRSGAFTRRELLREGGFHTGGGLWEQAAHQAGIDSAQARELFFPSQWDRPYKQKYYLCGREEEAALAAEYIGYFLQKFGVSDGQRHASSLRDRAQDRDGRAHDSRQVPVRQATPAR